MRKHKDSKEVEIVGKNEKEKKKKENITRRKGRSTEEREKSEKGRDKDEDMREGLQVDGTCKRYIEKEKWNRLR
jgi:hypothetical protein